MTPEEITRQRQAVITEALTWSGTPYLHGECVKGAGVDCASFIAATFNNAIGAHLTVEKYPEQWYLNADVQRYLNSLRAQGFVEVKYESAQIADLVISKPMTDMYSHGGILVSWPKPAAAIHCSKKGVRKPEHNMYSTWYFGQRRETHLYFRWGGWI